MNLIKNSNIAIAFLIEIFAIFILGYWGFTLHSSKIIRVTAGLLAPILTIVIWSIWCAPSSSYRLEGLWLVALKCLLFGIVVCCLLSTKQSSAAVIFGAIIVINLGLSAYFGTL
ncbi:YrdB family protein [Enterococcus sp. LJL128]